MKRWGLLVLVFLTSIAICQDKAEIVELLKSSDWDRSLTRILSDRSRLTPIIIDALLHEEAVVRSRAALAIRRIDSVDVDARSEETDGVGASRAKAVLNLAKSAKDADEGVRREAIWALAYLLRNRDWGHHGEPWSELKEVQPLIDLGKDATLPLIEVLRHEDPNDDVLYGTKIAVARVFAVTKDPRAIDALIHVVKSSSHFQMSEAMKALSQFEDPRVVPTLIDKMDDGIMSYADTPGIWALIRIKQRAIPYVIDAISSHPKAAVRFRAAHFFEHVPDPRAVHALQRATADPDEYVRASAAGSLGHNPHPSNAGVLSPLLKDSSKIVRASAATAFGLLGGSNHFEAVASLLNDSDFEVKRAAIYALPKLNGPRSIPILIPFLKDKGLQQLIVYAIAPLKPKQAESELIDVARSGEEYARNAAADLLGEMGSKDAVPVLLAMIAEEEWYPRTAAVRALGKIGEPAVEGLLKLLPTASEGVQWDVLIALGSTRDPRAFGAIKPYLDNDKTRRPALEGLGKSGDKRAIPLILPYLSSTDGDLLRYAVEAAGDLKATDAVPQLIQALKFEGDYVASNAAEALGKIGDKRAFEALLGIAQNRDFGGRWMAIEALGVFPDSRSIPVLVGLLGADWPDSAAAARALGKVGDATELPALEKAAQSDDERLAGDAKAAISEIRKRLS
jgi:HEAT repeat protein